MPGRMDEKVALITGGARGIGRSAAELLCAEGARVLLVDREEAALTSMAGDMAGKYGGDRVAAYAGDVANPAHAQEAVAAAVAKFRKLDVLIANAAVRNLSSIESADAAAWKQVFDVNVLGAVEFCKAALPELRKSKRGSVVIVSSCYATMGRKGFGAYDASKAATLSLMRTLAWEEAQYGLRVNAVCPGGTLTPFTVGRAEARGLSIEGMRAQQKSDSLLQRWAEPSEIAYPILWLASDEASYITGATLQVDGGLNIM